MASNSKGSKHICDQYEKPNHLTLVKKETMEKQVWKLILFKNWLLLVVIVPEGTPPLIRMLSILAIVGHLHYPVYILWIVKFYFGTVVELCLKISWTVCAICWGNTNLAFWFWRRQELRIDRTLDILKKSNFDSLTALEASSQAASRYSRTVAIWMFKWFISMIKWWFFLCWKRGKLIGFLHLCMPPHNCQTHSRNKNEWTARKRDTAF